MQIDFDAGAQEIERFSFTETCRWNVHMSWMFASWHHTLSIHIVCSLKENFAFHWEWLEWGFLSVNWLSLRHLANQTAHYFALKFFLRRWYFITCWKIAIQNIYSRSREDNVPLSFCTGVAKIYISHSANLNIIYSIFWWRLKYRCSRFFRVFISNCGGKV